jgi:hypothetical protein
MNLRRGQAKSDSKAFKDIMVDIKGEAMQRIPLFDFGESLRTTAEPGDEANTTGEKMTFWQKLELLDRMIVQEPHEMQTNHELR